MLLHEEYHLKKDIREQGEVTDRALFWSPLIVRLRVAHDHVMILTEVETEVAVEGNVRPVRLALKVDSEPDFEVILDLYLSWSPFVDDVYISSTFML
ncbi:hypothetical protein DPMN_130723 [Dreissena polymorpha]|uniref:Uncharacterized protein n=1 Tax=Dreissena polymorpha TaxID=45954 RepID=A0A9D4JYM8_DREPO|nr:hypothetical protein DPMN_130723 [Dreissena polymorpha]